LPLAATASGLENIFVRKSLPINQAPLATLGEDVLRRPERPRRQSTSSEKRRDHMMRYFTAILLMFAGALPATAVSPLATLDELKTALEQGAIVWDVRPVEEYERGHIPGAVNLGDPTQVLRHPETEEFLAGLRVADLLGAAGIDPARPVIVYGRRGAAQAYFGRHALLHFGGHGARVYHDGVEGWLEAGGPLRTGPNAAQPVAVKLHRRSDLIASTPDIVRALADPWAVQLVDSRSRPEFEGKDIRAVRGGHIPGAVNIPYETNWNDPMAGRRPLPGNAGRKLKDRAALADLYSVLDPEKETIVYCQSGTRAAVTAAVLQDLGFRNVRVYDASWLGYAARLDLPAENETFANIGRMEMRLQTLERRVRSLEGPGKQPAGVKPQAAGG
jgi:thiosulfate/3-mercaptopyruvate sulfurtransferase